MDNYDTIVLIYPNWWGTMPQAVTSFLEEYDFTGKTVYPLCTHEGSGMDRSVTDLRALVPGAQIMEGLAVRGSGVAEYLGHSRSVECSYDEKAENIVFSLACGLVVNGIIH